MDTEPASCMWSVFIVKFLISARSLDGFSPFFFFLWDTQERDESCRCPCLASRAPLLLPRHPQSKGTGNQPLVFQSLAAFPHLPVPIRIRLTSSSAIPHQHLLGAFWALPSPLLLLVLPAGCSAKTWCWGMTGAGGGSDVAHHEGHPLRKQFCCSCISLLQNTPLFCRVRPPLTKNLRNFSWNLKLIQNYRSN